MWKRLVIAGMALGALLPTLARADAVKAHTVTVKRRPVEIYASYPGTVIPAEYVQVASRMSGYVQDIKVHEGQSVDKGQLLLTVNPVAVAAGVHQARAQLAKARSALHTAKQNYDRFKALYKEGAVPKQRYEQVQLAYQAARSDYQAAQAALQKAQSQVGYAKVRAPFDGVIFSKKVHNGQLVGPGNELMVLYNPKQLQVKTELDDAAYYPLKLGEKIPVTYLGPNQQSHRVQATVQRLVAASNPMTHTHTVKLLLPADSKAQGGEYAQVLVPVKQQQAIVIPAAAIRERAGITGVFVVDSNGEAEFRMITPGQRRDHGRVVLSGLFPGDEVVVKSEGELANGVKVEAIGGGHP
ncbi:MAG TPA: efflux RND transporter periplasmic adaptor subunit [Gammaproteobacteria bacterium]|nr:efflux RND transporter periplasmic adaptor subunit [Gammaproteobacteria bacterium]